MTKEKQEILEMAKMFCEKLTYASRICVKDCKSSDCLFLDYANIAYKEGYRKADEVRKETAEDVLLCIMCSRIVNKYGTFSPEWEVLCEVLSDINSLITERFNLRSADEC